MKLEVGYNHPFDVREYNLLLKLKTGFSILYISDLHLNGNSSETVDRLVQQVNAKNPGIILLGGDYVDTKQGLHQLGRLLEGIVPGRQVFAIAGNHDHFFGIGPIRQAMLSNNVMWVNKTYHVLNLEGLEIGIHGDMPFEDASACDVNILLLHKPIAPPKGNNKFHLIFAGHLHGCQAVFWRTGNGLFPGRLFYKWNIEHVLSGNCFYLVSKGMGDTLPIRYNCPKDIILVNIF